MTRNREGSVWQGASTEVNLANNHVSSEAGPSPVEPLDDDSLLNMLMQPLTDLGPRVTIRPRVPRTEGNVWDAGFSFL